MTPPLETIATAAAAGLALLLASLMLRRWLARRRGESGGWPVRLALTLPLLALLWLAFHLSGLATLIIPFLAVAVAVICSVLWAPTIGAWLARPITNAIDGGNEPPDSKPHYAIARALLLRGKIAEADAEVRAQLGRFPSDHQGHLLLAEIQARYLHDLPAAETTIQLLCAQPGMATRERLAALATLADWHEKLGRNPAAAAQVRRQMSALGKT
jgi:hypothetical protein